MLSTECGRRLRLRCPFRHMDRADHVGVNDTAMRLPWSKITESRYGLRYHHLFPLLSLSQEVIRFFCANLRPIISFMFFWNSFSFPECFISFFRSDPCPINAFIRVCSCLFVAKDGTVNFVFNKIVLEVDMEISWACGIVGSMKKAIDFTNDMW